jgi:rubredoxin
MADILNNNPVSTTPVSTPIPDITSNVAPVNQDAYVVKEAPAHGIDSSWRRGKCMVCGYVYEGMFKGEMVCPKCGNKDQDKFDDAD